MRSLRIVAPAAACLVLAAFPLRLVAQEEKSEESMGDVIEEELPGVSIGNIKIDSVENPTKAIYLSPVPQKSVPFKDWIRVEAELRLNPSTDEYRESEWIKEVRVTMHLLSPENPREKLERTRFSCTMVYGPVKKSQQVYVGAFVLPHVVEFYGGKQQFMATANAAVEVFIDGKVVAWKEKSTSSKKGEEQWFVNMSAQENILVPPTKTPFAFDVVQRYYPSKSSASGE